MLISLIASNLLFIKPQLLHILQYYGSWSLTHEILVYCILLFYWFLVLRRSCQLRSVRPNHPVTEKFGPPMIYANVCPNCFQRLQIYLKFLTYLNLIKYFRTYGECWPFFIFFVWLKRHFELYYEHYYIKPFRNYIFVLESYNGL